MNELEALLSQWTQGTEISATQLLLFVEGFEEDDLQAAMDLLEAKEVTINLTGLEIHGSSEDTRKRLKLEQQLAKSGYPVDALDITDPLRLYLEELAAIPACGDIRCLAQAVGQANRAGEEDAESAPMLVNLSLSRVLELAGDYAGLGVLLLDLIQEGSIGLWELIGSYEGDGGDFETFRDRKIRFAMVRAVILQAHAAGVGQKMQQVVGDYRAVEEQLLGQLGRNPTPEELAEALHLSVEETLAAGEVLSSARMLNRAVKPEPEELPQEEDQAVEDTAYFQMRQRIAELLSNLPEQDVKILTLRYGLNNALPMTAGQVAEKLGMTEDAVNAREAAALMQLRQQK